MSNPHRILYTRHDGGVNICSPATAILRLMEGGGGWYDEQAHVNGLHDASGNSVSARMKFELDKKVQNGSKPEAAQRLIRALASGGCTTAEALDIIRHNDCEPHGVAFERKTGDEIPTDRRYRNAWRRGMDGGPIFIDMDAMRFIHAQLIERAFRKLKRPTPAKFSNRFRLDIMEGPKVDLDWDQLETAIRRAKTPEELQAVWPKGLA